MQKLKLKHDRKIEKDAVPNEDYGSDVLNVQSLEELRQTVIKDETRYYSWTSGTTLSLQPDHIKDTLFLTSSGMAVGWNNYKNSHYLVFSGSTSPYFEIRSGLMIENLPDTSLRYITTGLCKA